MYLHAASEIGEPADEAADDVQRPRLADIRRVCDGRLAERSILHQGDLRKAQDPEQLEQPEQNYRRDRERVQSERECKLAEVRGEKG